MPKENSSAPLVLKYMEKWRDLPTMTLAKKIYKEHPELFATHNTVRGIIQYHRGSAGEINRKRIEGNKFKKPLTHDTTPFQFPESRIQPQNEWRLPKSATRVLVLSDLHIPEHDEKAIRAACRYGKEKNINAIYINGDFLDMYTPSFHEKRHHRWSVNDELEDGRTFLKWLRNEFKCPIYIIPGNHDQRLERYLMVKAPELLDCPEFKLDVLLKYGENGITHIPFRSKAYFGKLLVEHGDKMAGSGGVNPARTALLKFKRPVLVSHFHRTTSANQKVYDGHNLMAWSIGCLCTLEPGFMEVNEHNHGAAIIDVNHADGNFRVENFQIINGKVY